MKHEQSKWLTGILLFITASTACGQIESDWENQAANFIARVKNIEFFIDRFNNQPDGSGRVSYPTNDSTAHKLFFAERRRRIFALLDLQRVNRDDVAMKEKLAAFFTAANDPAAPVFINFGDRAWWAELNLDGHIDGQPTTLQCNLQVVRSAEGIYTWVIRSFASDRSNIAEKADSLLVFAPSAHGTDFMDVRLRLQDKLWIEKIYGNSPSPSQTLAQLGSHRLNIKRVASIRYYFAQVPGWLVEVRYVDRSTPDSGWLIYDVQRLSSEVLRSLLDSKALPR